LLMNRREGAKIFVGGNTFVKGKGKREKKSKGKNILKGDNRHARSFRTMGREKETTAGKKIFPFTIVLCLGRINGTNQLAKK